jgi:hypothetical protein
LCVHTALRSSPARHVVAMCELYGVQFDHAGSMPVVYHLVNQQTVENRA